MKLSEIKTPVSVISGVGPQLTKTLAKLNIFTVSDLLQYYPKDYEDRTKRIPLAQWNLHKKVHTVAKVVSQEWFGYGKMKTLKIIIDDGTATGELICFNRTFLEKVLVPQTIITVTGQFFLKYNAIQSTAFETTVMDSKDCVLKDGFVDYMNTMPLNSKVIPVYPLTEGLSQKNIQKAISQAIQQYALGIDNDLPDSIITRRSLLSKNDAIRKIHMPPDLQAAEQARRTLAYEELYDFQYAVCEHALKHRGSIPSLTDNASTETKISFTKEEFISSLSPLQKKFLEKLPFELTDDQMKVIQEMNSDIDKGYEERNRILVQYDRGIPVPKRQPFTMSRLLQGDVGSGKTLCALFACLRVISWKGQCAFMAPTEILARQHAETTFKFFDDLGIKTAFLTGKVKSAGRNQLLKALKEGEIDILIGTHALFSNNVQYNDLQLAVIDEQHRFGVMQRQSIIAKGRVEKKCSVTFEPHLLMMSATPIPQSLALTFFGDLDISTIKTKPSGRQEIKTYLVKEGNERNAYEAVRKELEKGRQAYFVYPAIDSETGLKSAERSFQNLSKNVFPQFKCALIHSQIDEDLQVQILNDFYTGNIQILAATTVIEVGVDVPNATCMVIENADYFGMSQLHQLRGRVGRGSDQSYCFLIYSNNITQTGIERIKALRQSTDGFYLAEQDLKTRGPGELNGKLQSGTLSFQIADLTKDLGLLSLAKIDAIEQLKNTNSN